MKEKWAYLVIGVLISAMFSGTVLFAQRSSSGTTRKAQQMGMASPENFGRYMITETKDNTWLLDTQTGQAWRYYRILEGMKVGDEGWNPVLFALVGKKETKETIEPDLLFFDFQQASDSVKDASLKYNAQKLLIN